MAKNKNLFNEENVIRMIFENDKKVYSLDENLLTSAAKYTGNKIKQAGKDIGKGLLNFAAFNFICRVIAEQLNKSWALKRATGQIVGNIYQKALIVLSFFYKSKYKLILLRGFTKYYSWDLALAIIFIHEGFENQKGITFAVKSAYGVTPDIMKQKIELFHEKIKSKRVVLNMLSLDVVDKDAVIDKSREVGGKFGKIAIETDKIAAYFKRFFAKLSNPDTFIRNIDKYKRLGGSSPETIAYLDMLTTTLNDINAYWDSIMSPSVLIEVKDAIYRGQAEVKFTRPKQIKDSTGKIIDISSTGGVVNINSAFILNDIQNPDAEIMKTKIIFCILLKELKSSPLELRATKEIISKIDLLKNPK